MADTPESGNENGSAQNEASETTSETTEAPVPAPVAETVEEPAPSAEALEVLYVEATELYGSLWKISRKKAPGTNEIVVQAKNIIKRIQDAILASIDDADQFRRIWKWEQGCLSDALKLEADEVILRNLADVQDDLIRTLGFMDAEFQKAIDNNNVVALLGN